MKEVQFVAGRQGEWAAWDRWLAGAVRRRGRAAAATDEAPRLALAEIPAAFRRLCRDLALARDRRYSAALVEALHTRVLAVHQRIYGAPAAGGAAFLAFLAGGFPALVRREGRFVLAASLLLALPLLAALLLLQLYPEGVYLLLSPEQVLQFERMYAPDAAHLGRPRSAGSEWQMWGHYVANNVRIDFQCFAGGITFGVGAVFFLIYNGLMIGGVAGHLTQVGLGEAFWGFVAGHSAFELSGAVLAGAAGLKIGFALVAPGDLSRPSALRAAAPAAAALLAGAAAMTFLAAFVEAFWSPARGTPLGVKLGVGLAGWLLTWSYLLFAGRGRGAA